MGLLAPDQLCYVAPRRRWQLLWEAVDAETPVRLPLGNCEVRGLRENPTCERIWGARSILEKVGWRGREVPQSL